MDKNRNKDQSIDIKSLLKKVDSRTTPSEEMSVVAKENVRRHWQQMVVKKKQPNKQRYVWAMAASVVFAAVLTIFTLQQQEPILVAKQIASISGFSGSVQFKTKGKAWQSLAIETEFNANTTIKTSDSGYLALTLADRSELRVDNNTELTIDSGTINLIKGNIYHDTDDVTQTLPLLIQTNQGIVQHVGTRYVVSQKADQLNVAVRNGKVKFTATSDQNKQHTINANQLLTSSDAMIQVSAVNPYDSVWGWTFKSQANYQLDGKSLYEFVTWFARQTGLDVDWSGLQSNAKRIRLSGNIKNISSDQAIKTVFLSTQLNYNINNGVLQITTE
ncbi:FecR domain-containing protein [Marinicella sp. S1101]|uniref:FecR family protein n=1 Tax=Marinicella marina TaxID=2996016 RepID=UPI002260D0BB|nr:FecR domain-containing protein [Marinicella marina]MCX7554198.1 FecR domain-containing protein [Marinicella marina]MDJ1141109.1 FecR domain-containing protein [Marinicella marina]